MSFTNASCGRIDGLAVCSLADDAMVSMRYARFVAEGHGLVWNLGERVEGYTNPLWTLVMAVVHLVAPPVLAVRLMQAIGALASLAVVLVGAGAAVRVAALSGRPGRLELPLTLLGAAILSLCYPVHYWSLSGMEVGPLSLCAVLAFRILVQCLAGRLDEDGAAARCVVLALIAYLLRPDGVIALAVPVALTLLLAVERWRTGRGAFPRLAGTALAVAAVTAASHLLARRLYYGEWLPNTYVLKMQGLDGAHRLENGLRFVASFLDEHFLVLLTVTTLSLLVRKGGAVYGAGLVQMACLCAYQAYVGGDPWSSWRHLAPGLAVIYLLIASGLGAVAVNGSRLPAGRGLVTAVVGLLATSGLLQSNQRFAGEILLRDPPLVTVGGKLNALVAMRLREVLEPSALVSVFWAGTLPYYWHGPAADALGKTDRRIARLQARDSPAWLGMAGVPGHNKYDLEYSLHTQAPDFIEGWRWGYEDYTAYVVRHFVEVEYKGVPMCVRRDSPRVRWSLVTVRGSCVRPARRLIDEHGLGP